jgi:hypothetical protein
MLLWAKCTWLPGLKLLSVREAHSTAGPRCQTTVPPSFHAKHLFYHCRVQVAPSAALKGTALFLDWLKGHAAPVVVTSAFWILVLVVAIRRQRSSCSQPAGADGISYAAMMPDNNQGQGATQPATLLLPTLQAQEVYSS